jgi:CelD/BcsL family acetyltransferase involved in cellulose biosynthesis
MWPRRGDSSKLTSETMPPAIATKLGIHQDGLCATNAQAHDAAAPRAENASVALTVFEDLAEIENDWRAFERDADCTVFQSFDWLSLWQHHIGALTAVRPAIIVGRDAAGAMLFILPLATQRTGFARELVWLGSDLCDFNAPLLSRRFPAQVGEQRFLKLWQNALDRLQDNERLRFDLVRLKKMPALLGTQKNPMLTLHTMLNPSGSYVTELMDDWETFYKAKRSSSTRSRERTKRKRLAEFGPLAFVSAGDANDSLTSLNTLMTQKSRSFARMGVSNIFEKPGHLAFYRALSTDPRTRSMVHISRLDCGERPAAVNLGLTFRDTYYHLQASHDDGELGRFGPGAAHLNELLRYAIERGFKYYDFTIGDEAYKRDWCDSAQPLYDHIAIATGRGACVFLPTIGKNWLTRQIKQSPALWKFFSKARASVGSLLGRKRNSSDGAAL